MTCEEEKHIAAFKEILESVRKYEPPESYPYEGTKGVVRESECILIDILILQEQDHLKRLSDLKENL